MKDVKRGKSPTYNAIGSTLVFAQKCNVKSGGIDMSLAKFLDEKVIGKYSEEEFLRDCDIVVNSTGTGTMGRIGLFHDSDNPTGLPIVPDSHVTIVRPNQALSVAYLMCCLQYYQPYLEEHGEGSTNQKELKPDTIKNLFIPLPPESEQQRIVDIVGSLEPYISEYRRKDSQLSDLNKDFPNQLKKSILQLAVQGKLVDQDPNDEPAYVLLERIRAEKERLIAEGKIKRDKNESVIYRRDNSHYEKHGKTEVCIEEEIPFVIPDSWAWARLGSLIHLLSGQDFDPSGYNVVERGIPYITGASNIENGNVIINRWTDRPKNIAHSGELLVVCKGAGVGKMAVLREESVHIARQIMAIAPISTNLHYLQMILEYNLEYLRRRMQGVIPGISRSDVLNLLCPVPPLVEQERIARQVELILPLVKFL